jgi:hypothetical protein
MANKRPYWRLKSSVKGSASEPSNDVSSDVFYISALAFGMEGDIPDAIFRYESHHWGFPREVILTEIAFTFPSARFVNCSHATLMCSCLLVILQFGNVQGTLRVWILEGGRPSRLCYVPLFVWPGLSIYHRACRARLLLCSSFPLSSWIECKSDNS